jgi:Flp pilus assembly protein TadG
MRVSVARFASRAGRNEAGAAAIEFAMVASTFFVLIFGILIYGSYFASLSLVNHIAFEAARAAVSGLSDDERSTLAQARAAALVQSYDGFLNGESVEVSSAELGNGIYAVTVTHEFDAFGLMSAITILPLPPAHQTATYEMSRGGY